MDRPPPPPPEAPQRRGIEEDPGRRVQQRMEPVPNLVPLDMEQIFEPTRETISVPFMIPARVGSAGVTETRLLEHVSLGDIQQSGCTFEDLCELCVDHTFVWLATNVCITREYATYPTSVNCTCRVCVDYHDGSYRSGLCVWSDSASPEELTGVYEKISMFLEQPQPSGVIILSDFNQSVEPLRCFPDAANRAHMEVLFYAQHFTEGQSLQLGTFGGPLKLRNCSFTDNGNGLLGGIARSSGPRELTLEATPVDAPLLQVAMRESETLETLELDMTSDLNMDSIIDGIRGGSLGTLKVFGLVTAVQWKALFQALRTQTTLTTLHLSPSRSAGALVVVDPSLRGAYNGCVVVDCLRENHCLVDVRFPIPFLDEPGLLGLIESGLMANRYRPRLMTLLEEPLSRNVLTNWVISRRVRDPNLLFLMASMFADQGTLAPPTAEELGNSVVRSFYCSFDRHGPEQVGDFYLPNATLMHNRHGVEGNDAIVDYLASCGIVSHDVNSVAVQTTPQEQMLLVVVSGTIRFRDRIEPTRFSETFGLVEAERNRNLYKIGNDVLLLMD